MIDTEKTVAAELTGPGGRRQRRGSGRLYRSGRPIVMLYYSLQDVTTGEIKYRDTAVSFLMTAYECRILTK